MKKFVEFHSRYGGRPVFLERDIDNIQNVAEYGGYDRSPGFKPCTPYTGIRTVKNEYFEIRESAAEVFAAMGKPSPHSDSPIKPHSSVVTMNQVQVTVTFTVNEELVPGLFYDPIDFGTEAMNAVKKKLSTYDPRLIRVETSNSTYIPDSDEHVKEIQSNDPTSANSEPSCP